jgi:hypothetical protein
MGLRRFPTMAGEVKDAGDLLGQQLRENQQVLRLAAVITLRGRRGGRSPCGP